MPKLELELEAITPLFLGGAEPRGSPPELRAASVRGALRYWLRALLGGTMGDGDLDALRATEDSVFGSTNAGASAIILTLAHNGLETTEFRKRGAIRERGQFKPEGADYLLWSMSETGKKERGNWQPARQYIVPGARFTMAMRPRLGAPGAEDAWWRASAALWLLTQLGALGSRSRRGAGSLCVTEEPGQADLPPFKPPPAVRDLQAQLESGLRQIRESLVMTGSVRTPPRFDVLAPGACNVWILADGRPWSTWQQALDGIGGQMRDFRSRRRPDYETMRDWMKRGATPRTVERAAFGLPLPFRYSRGGPFDVVQGSQHDRRSSPLWLRVTKLGNGQHVGVATLFKSAFLAERESLQLQRGRHTTAPPEDCSLIEEFIASFPTHLEVKL
ncbi:MAG TPA: type III-B CRISPR module RAMP protein Cmr1 [Chloroflexi bacterium]|nr:type III-B CRISPR module RAMP protein Cmr1 [Chloroflexota bacterium]